MKFDDYVLCYVSEGFAWFTSCPLESQWGDDWNDAPYEHNAGYPYPDHCKGNERVQHDLVKIGFAADLYRPCDGQLNSPYSVEDINAGKSPWLKSWAPDDFVPETRIFAGCNLKNFIEKIESCGGEVYLPKKLLPNVDI